MEISAEMLPGYPGVSVLRKQASSKKEADAIIANFKDNVFAYRISVDGNVAFESHGTGAKKRWFKVGHPWFAKVRGK